MQILRAGVIPAILCCATAASGQVSFQDIGSLQGTPYASQDFGFLRISEDGTTVTGNVGLSNSSYHAFIWRAETGMQDLSPGATDQLSAYAVNHDGSVVVGARNAASNPVPIRWTAATGVQPINLPGWTGSTAMGVSQNGLAVAGFGSVGTNGRAFYWTSAGGAVDVGPAALTYLGISGDGSTVVGSSLSHGYYWTQSGGLHNLSLLPGTSSATAVASNRDGSMFVGWCTRTSDMRQRACRWTLAGDVLNLGLLPNANPISFSNAVAISDDGSVVIGNAARGASGVTGPFFWTQTQGMVDLTDFMVAHGVNLTGWQMSDVSGVSGDGYTMTGTGFHAGVGRGWILRLRPPCATADFNQDGDVGTDADINAFFACLGGDCCAACPPNADFNADGDVGTDDDIESFFRVLAGGPCR